ncbi:MAG TPA: response regulator transcription factor [Jatrophihabitans sp.]|nr:response regulator transcription factor [Jatrophihabitans sp.]
MTKQVRERIGVLIIDDHRMFADSLARLLADEDDIEVLGIASDGDEGVQLAVALDPQVVLVDYRMPLHDGIAVATDIKRRVPDAMIVMLTGMADDKVLLAALEAGCSGYLTKDRAASEVANAVRVAGAGEALVSSRDLAIVLSRFSRNHHAVGSDLTEREREILVLLSRGMANRMIAEVLHLSVNTVRNYVQAILIKLDAHSKLEAVATGVREGVIEYPSGPDG